ncbi:unnamed protein product [Lampetra planeri]
MSRHLKKKNPPNPPSDDDDDSLDQSLLHQGATAPLAATAAASGTALRREAGADATPAADEGWRRVA